MLPACTRFSGSSLEIKEPKREGKPRPGSSVDATASGVLAAASLQRSLWLHRKAFLKSHRFLEISGYCATKWVLSLAWLRTRYVPLSA